MTTTYPQEMMGMLINTTHIARNKIVFQCYWNPFGQIVDPFIVSNPQVYTSVCTSVAQSDAGGM